MGERRGRRPQDGPRLTSPAERCVCERDRWRARDGEQNPGEHRSHAASLAESSPALRPELASLPTSVPAESPLCSCRRVPGGQRAGSGGPPVRVLDGGQGCRREDRHTGYSGRQAAMGGGGHTRRAAWQTVTQTFCVPSVSWFRGVEPAGHWGAGLQHLRPHPLDARRLPSRDSHRCPCLTKCPLGRDPR